MTLSSPPTPEPPTPEPPTGAAPEAEARSALLLRVGRDRDRNAFALLFGHYAPRLKAFMRKMGADDAVAEDLMQEAMLTVWRRADSFDPQKASAGTWIYTIARNLRIDRIRRERRPELDPDDPALIPALVSEAPPPADERLHRERVDDRVRAALKDLPPEQAAVVALSFYEDAPHADIAARLGVPLGTVKSRLRLAMKRVRESLGDCLS